MIASNSALSMKLSISPIPSPLTSLIRSLVAAERAGLTTFHAMLAYEGALLGAAGIVIWVVAPESGWSVTTI